MPVIHGRPQSQPFLERLLVLLFAFAPAFIILSLSYEALFFAVLCTTLVLWMLIECQLAEDRTSKTINAEHLRIALFFLTFLHVCFFGVGNVASISSVSSLLFARCASLILTRPVLPRACLSPHSRLCSVPDGPSRELSVINNADCPSRRRLFFSSSF